MPDDVQDVFGFALGLAQAGLKHDAAKPLKGFGSAGVLEVVESDEGGTYRAVYTVRLPKPDLDLIKSRLKDAEMDHAAWSRQTKGVQQ